QIPRMIGTVCADQRTQLNRLLAGVDHLEVHDRAIPQSTSPHDLLEPAPHPRYRHAVVDPQEHRSDQVGGVPGPVLEGLLQEVGQRDTHAPPIPQLHDDVCAGDLLDDAVFAFQHDNVVDTDGLADGDLNAGEQVGEQWPRRQADDYAGRTGRCDQADAV